MKGIINKNAERPRNIFLNLKYVDDDSILFSFSYLFISFHMTKLCLQLIFIVRVLVLVYAKFLSAFITNANR